MIPCHAETEKPENHIWFLPSRNTHLGGERQNVKMLTHQIARIEPLKGPRDMSPLVE